MYFWSVLIIALRACKKFCPIIPEKFSFEKLIIFHWSVPWQPNSFGNGVVTTYLISFEPFSVLKYKGFSGLTFIYCSVSIPSERILVVEPVSIRHLID